jgi:hypothetical protein
VVPILCLLLGSAMGAHAEPAGLTLTVEQGTLRLSDGARVVAQAPVASLLGVMYSETPSRWEAQTWAPLAPDAVAAQVGGDLVRLQVDSFGGKPICLTATGQISQARREVLWRLELHNGATGTVVGVSGPRLAGLGELEGASLYIPNRSGHRLPDPWTHLTARGSVGYPVPASMQYLVYANDTSGVAFHVQDAGMSYKLFTYGGPEHELGVLQFPFVEPGQDWHSGGVLWQVLDGDWHQAADRYRRWFRAWARRPQLSPQLRRFPTWGGTVVKSRPVDDPNVRDVLKRQETGTYAGALEQIKQLHAGGFGGTHLVGWFGQGHDTTYPDFDPAPDMGGEEGLKDLIRQAHDMGMGITLYLNARLANLTNPTYLAHPQWRALEGNGAQWREGYGDQQFALLCPAVRGWQEHLTAVVERVAGEYKGDGVQLDQIGAATSVLCFDPSHGHRTPATAWAEGYRAMLRMIRAAAEAHNPEFWLWVEGAWEGAGQYVDLSQGGFWPDAPGAVAFPELYRYTLPEHMVMSDAALGAMPYWCPSDIHRADRINAAAGEVFLKGEFLDNQGLTSEPVARLHWFRAGRRVVVSVSNDSDAEQTYRVHLRPAGWLPVAPAKARALAAGGPVAVAAAEGAWEFMVTVPGRQVESVMWGQ